MPGLRPSAAAASSTAVRTKALSRLPATTRGGSAGAADRRDEPEFALRRSRSVDRRGSTRASRREGAEEALIGVPLHAPGAALAGAARLAVALQRHAEGGQAEA